MNKIQIDNLPSKSDFQDQDFLRLTCLESITRKKMDLHEFFREINLTKIALCPWMWAMKFSRNRFQEKIQKCNTELY